MFGSPIVESNWFDSRDEALAYARYFFCMKNVSIELYDCSTSKTECLKSKGEVLNSFQPICKRKKRYNLEPTNSTKGDLYYTSKGYSPMININNIPVEPTVTILNPNGSELITTNNITTFSYIRLEIKKNNLSGYKVRDENGNIYDIHANGKIYNEPDYHWPNGLTGEVYDEILCNLI
jgi:hypothetical protein